MKATEGEVRRRDAGRPARRTASRGHARRRARLPARARCRRQAGRFVRRRRCAGRTSTSRARASARARSRVRHGSGMTTSAAAARPGICAQSGATGMTQTRLGSPRGARAGCRAPTAVPPSDLSGANTVPSRASGVTTSVAAGMATRLARKPTRQTCWKKTGVSGVRPSVAITCLRRSVRTWAKRRARQPRQPGSSEGGSLAAAGLATMPLASRPPRTRARSPPASAPTDQGR